MELNKYLDKVAYKENMEIGASRSEVYKSKFDNSYMTHVGMEDNLKFLAEREITGQLTHGVGFSKKDGKWYGWSHRDIYGFEIGSTCKKGDAHYVGSDIKEQEDAAVLFWQDDCHENVRCEGIIKDEGDRYFDVKWDYKDNTPNKKLHNTIGGTRHYITPLGNGEWTAETMADAKQMAVDFNEGVS